MGGYFQGLKVLLEVKMILWVYISVIESNYLNNMHREFIKFPMIRKLHEIHGNLNP